MHRSQKSNSKTITPKVLRVTQTCGKIYMQVVKLSKNKEVNTLEDGHKDNLNVLKKIKNDFKITLIYFRYQVKFFITLKPVKFNILALIKHKEVNKTEKFK